MPELKKLLSFVEIADLDGDLKEIAELIGVEATMKLVEVYGGSRLYFPVPDQVLIPVRHRRVLKAYFEEGKSIDDIRRETRYGESTIREILFKNGDTRQTAMFEKLSTG